MNKKSEKIAKSIRLPIELEKKLSEYLKENYLPFTIFITQLIMDFFKKKDFN
jgi:hypothetical protein